MWYAEILTLVVCFSDNSEFCWLRYDAARLRWIQDQAVFNDFGGLAHGAERLKKPLLDVRAQQCDARLLEIRLFPDYIGCRRLAHGCGFRSWWG